MRTGRPRLDVQPYRPVVGAARVRTQEEAVRKLHTEKTEIKEKFAEIISLKVSFRTRMYNQLMKRSNSISKPSRGIRESSEFDQHKDFLVDIKFK